MALTVDGRCHRFGVREPFSFDGGSQTMCEVAGPSRDLNVMTRRGRATASVAIVEAEASDRAPVEAATTVLVCLTASVVLTDTNGTDVELGVLDAAVSGSTPVAVRGNGIVAVIQLQSAAA